MTIEWQTRDRVLSTASGTILMGIVNVTPDSFSDGGRYLNPETAVAHGIELSAQGAAIVDVGGESTRPGAKAVAAAEELARVLPVVKGLAAEGVAVSIDTSKAEVAETALAAGAVAVNDVTALGDPDMASVVAGAGAGVVLMHMQGVPRSMQADPRYDDVVKEVAAYLEQRAETAEAAGIPRRRICIDPGFGFGKLLHHNLALLRNLDVLVGTGRPVLLGTSRKSSIARLVASEDEDARDQGTAATVALAVASGVAILRVHNVAMASKVAAVADAIVRADFSAEDPL